MEEELKENVSHQHFSESNTVLGVVIFVAYVHFIVELIQLKQDDVIL